MEQNKIRTYIFYALGEIFLVVIGILIALQINNWNETQKENKTEIRYLERFITEVSNDIEHISNAIRSNEGRKQRAEFLIDASKDQRLVEENPTYFIESIEYAGYTNSPGVLNQTFEEIKSSGRLSLIRNEDLRNAISLYYTGVENRGQYRFITEEIQLKYLDYRVGILNDKQQISMGSFITRNEYSLSEADSVYKRMVEKKEFTSWLPYIVQSKIRTHENFENRLTKAEELRVILENELINIQ